MIKTDNPKTTILGVRFDEKTKAEIKRYAEKEEIPMSAIVRKIVKQFLREKGELK